MAERVTLSMVYPTVPLAAVGRLARLTIVQPISALAPSAPLLAGASVSDPEPKRDITEYSNQTHFGARPSGLAEAWKVLQPIIEAYIREQFASSGAVKAIVQPQWLADP